MFLQRIEIHGFKSFAQKTTLEFPRPGQGCPLVTNNDQATGLRLQPGTCGVACIVGPNGSGKSNIVDAVRWVLGEQSLKSLRGKKSEDVIFTGSDKKARLGMAEVALHINNEDGMMAVDYKEVIISRKIYRNGESEYLINKSKVRLQDVLMLLAKANFGQKSYSIVSQGSIDQVIMATPADRKEYFDEAVGVKQFQIKRDQSINKLESAWNNLRQVDALLTEIKPRLNSLTRQVKRLERREKIEIQLKEIQQQYFGFLWHDLNDKIKEVKPRLTETEKELSEKSRQLRALQDQLQALEKEDSRSKVFNELQQKYQKVLDQKNKLREEQLILQNKIEIAKQRLTEKPVPLALSEILSRLKEISDLRERLIDNLEPKDQAKFAQAKEDLRELGSLIKDLIEQLQNPKVKEKVKAEIDPSWLQDLKAVEKDLIEIESQLDLARQAITHFNQSEEQKKGKFFDLQRQITTKQNEYNSLSGQASFAGGNGQI
ncbi:MAG: AAA family ATPase [Candidatus Buchananbacteria bacterium]